jgi:peptidoglycan DL-endopeptidase CwlO
MALIIGTTPASADPIADKKAQAAAVQSQVSALDTKVEIATENYNRASERYAKLTSQVRSTSRKLEKLHAKMNRLQTALDTRADRMYREGALGFVEVLLNAKSFDDFNTTWQVLTNINTQDANTVADLRVTRKDAETTYASLKTAQAQASAQKTAMGKSKQAVIAQLAARKQMLAGINADIRNLVAQQQAQEAAAARAAYLSSTSGSGRIFHDSGGSPPSNLSQGLKVVWWARQQLGKPYVWAADGPDSFDCSGLAMYCWGKVGVGLSHSSAEQINEGARVSRANLEPGDLVFFGSPIHHVGIYIGGGQMIEAPHTGANVRVANAFRGDYAGACRP